ncbi:MAG TPA: acyl-CoA dehydrogenase family protein, partial [Candidatus Binatia bacterium]|nr:acyl-CoA dehydrogenase family protein [Candidatus Binatia bacterium]
MPKPAYLTPEVEQFRSAFRAFVESKVTPQIGEWEQKGALPRAFWRAMGEHGFLCPWIAEADGGPEAPFGFSVVVCEELGRTGAMGIQTAVSVHSDISVPYLAELAHPAERVRWLKGALSGEIVTAIAMTEPGAGSDLASIRTTA